MPRGIPNNPKVRKSTKTAKVAKVKQPRVKKTEPNLVPPGGLDPKSKRLAFLKDPVSVRVRPPAPQDVPLFVPNLMRLVEAEIYLEKILETKGMVQLINRTTVLGDASPFHGVGDDALGATLGVSNATVLQIPVAIVDRQLDVASFSNKLGAAIDATKQLCEVGAARQGSTVLHFYVERPGLHFPTPNRLGGVTEMADPS